MTLSSNNLKLLDLVFPDYLLELSSQSTNPNLRVVRICLKLDPNIWNDERHKIQQSVVVQGAKRLQKIIAILVAGSLTTFSCATQKEVKLTVFANSTFSNCCKKEEENSISVNFSKWMSIFNPSLQRQQEIELAANFIREVDFVVVSENDGSLFEEILKLLSSDENSNNKNNLALRLLKDIKRASSANSSSSLFIQSLKVMCLLLILLSSSSSTPKRDISQNLLESLIFYSSSTPVLAVFCQYFALEKILLNEVESQAVIFDVHERTFESCGEKLVSSLPSSSNSSQKQNNGGSHQHQQSGNRRERRTENETEEFNRFSSGYGSSKAALSHRKRSSLLFIFSLHMKKQNNLNQEFCPISSLHSILFAWRKCSTKSECFSSEDFSREILQVEDDDSFRTKELPETNLWWMKPKNVGIFFSVDYFQRLQSQQVDDDKNDDAEKNFISSAGFSLKISSCLLPSDMTPENLRNDVSKEIEKEKEKLKNLTPKQNLKPFGFTFPIVILHASLVSPSLKQLQQFAARRSKLSSNNNNGCSSSTQATPSRFLRVSFFSSENIFCNAKKELTTKFFQEDDDEDVLTISSKYLHKKPLDTFDIFDLKAIEGMILMKNNSNSCLIHLIADPTITHSSLNFIIPQQEQERNQVKDSILSSIAKVLLVADTQGTIFENEFSSTKLRCLRRMIAQRLLLLSSTNCDQKNNSDSIPFAVFSSKFLHLDDLKWILETVPKLDGNNNSNEISNNFKLSCFLDQLMGWGSERVQFLFHRAIAHLKKKSVLVEVQKKDDHQKEAHDDEEGEEDDENIAPHLLVIPNLGEGGKEQNVSCHVTTVEYPQIDELISRLRSWIRALEDQRDEY